MTDMPATDIPAGAQRSEDGQWWWDGAQWQPVPAHAAAGTTETQPASGTAGAEQARGSTSAQPASAAAEAPSETGGQLSEDGQWRWDGTQWQPAHTDPAAAATAATAGSTTATAGSSATTQSGHRVTLGVPTAESQTDHDGTTEAVLHYSITNSGSTPIEAGALQMGFFVMAAGQTAESAAYTSGDLPVALAVGEEHQGRAWVQVDPGTQTFFVSVSDKATGEILETTENVTFEIAGHQSADHAFDDTQTYTLTLNITSVELVSDALYRFHYDVQSDRDVPAGLRVSARIEGAAGTSGEIYDLTTPIAAGRSHPHYLTLEADAPSHSTATIMLDAGGPSEKSESVVVDIAENGTPTMSR
jgi:hypothetical protein